MSWSWWMTLCVLLAVFVLIGCIPVGVSAAYENDSVRLSLKVSAFCIQLLPAKQKKEKKKRAKKREATAVQKQETPASAPEKKAPEKKASPLLSGGVGGILELLDFAGDVLGDLRRKLRVEELTLYVTFGGKDPAKAAMNYGRAWAAIGALTPALERIFVIKKRDIQPVLDYNEEKMRVSARLQLTITIGRALALALHAGLRFLKLLQQRKKAVQANESSSV